MACGPSAVRWVVIARCYGITFYGSEELWGCEDFSVRRWGRVQVQLEQHPFFFFLKIRPGVLAWDKCEPRNPLPPPPRIFFLLCCCVLGAWRWYGFLGVG